MKKIFHLLVITFLLAVYPNVSYSSDSDLKIGIGVGPSYSMIGYQLGYKLDKKTELFFSLPTYQTYWGEDAYSLGLKYYFDRSSYFQIVYGSVTNALKDQDNMGFISTYSYILKGVTLGLGTDIQYYLIKINLGLSYGITLERKPVEVFYENGLLGSENGLRFCLGFGINV
jgi:hypothetical protein